jgi:Protein of unknown function, DUF547
LKISASSLIEFSRDILHAQRKGGNGEDFLNRLKGLPFKDLSEALSSDEQKKAFWINIYNAFVQYLLNRPGSGSLRRKLPFGKRLLVIGGHKFSLDDIEHGILRHSRMKWALGYLKSPWVPRIERKLRVGELDFRIHFALNCGANSCPAISFYDAERINSQLELSAVAYLSGEVRFEIEERTVKVPALLGWYRKDFGGITGIKSLLKGYGLIPAGINPRLKFNRYDWGIKPGNFSI